MSPFSKSRTKTWAELSLAPGGPALTLAQKKSYSKHQRYAKAISWRSSRGAALTVYGYGVRFYVDRGRLIIEDGFANEGLRRRLVLSRGTCTLQRIVVVGRTGFVTLDGLQWLADLGIALLFVGVGGKLNSVFAPGGLEGSKVRLHRLQANARESETGVRIAQLLIGQKLLGQQQILEWLSDPGRQILVSERGRIRRTRAAAQELRGLYEQVGRLMDLEEIIEAERSGGQVYWSSLTGIPLQWKPRDAAKVPSHWLTTQRRESFRTGNRYGATDPANALINYGYSLLEAETRIASYKAGLHPGLGIIHVDKDGRASFVYDLMEPVRPTVDRMVLEFIRSHTFTEGECWETREGFCRLDADLAALVTSWIVRLGAGIQPVIRGVTTEFKGAEAVGARLSSRTSTKKVVEQDTGGLESNRGSARRGR